MKKAYSSRIYPNKKQEIKLNRTLSTCRHLYNDSLKERRKQAELNRLCSEFQVFPWGKPEWISYEDQATDLASSKTLSKKRFSLRSYRIRSGDSIRPSKTSIGALAIRDSREGIGTTASHIHKKALI